MAFDKKFIHGRARGVLPTRIGAVTVTEAVPPELVRRVLRRYVG
jgi:3-dehydroquinate synthetase